MHCKITGIFMHTVGDAEINVSMFDTNLLANLFYVAGIENNKEKQSVH